MTLVRINNWSGGLGNNLEQIANAYWLARKTNGRFNCNAKHHILQVHKHIRFGKNIQPANHGTTNMAFINKRVDMGNERYSQYHEILQSLSPVLFKKVVKKPFDGLIVHVRSGNIYKDPSCGKSLIQAPLSYFAQAIETLSIKKDVLVITNQRHGRPGQPGTGLFPNPMVDKIVRYCKRAGFKCHIHDGHTLEAFVEAMGYLLGAEHAMLTGYTTFSRMLLLSNSDLKSVIIPAMSGWYHDEISFKKHKCDAHIFDIIGYLKEWSGEGLLKQISHPRNKIRYRGIL